VSLIAAGRSGPAVLAAYDTDGNLAPWGLGGRGDELSHLRVCPGSTTFVGIASWDQPRLVRRDVASLAAFGTVVLPQRAQDSWPMITDPRALYCVSPDGDVMFLVSASGYGDGGIRLCRLVMAGGLIVALGVFRCFALGDLLAAGRVLVALVTAIGHDPDDEQRSRCEQQTAQQPAGTDGPGQRDAEALGGPKSTTSSPTTPNTANPAAVPSPIAARNPRIGLAQHTAQAAAPTATTAAVSRSALTLAPRTASRGPPAHRPDLSGRVVSSVNFIASGFGVGDGEAFATCRAYGPGADVCGPARRGPCIRPGLQLSTAGEPAPYACVGANLVIRAYRSPFDERATQLLQVLTRFLHA
jgi:hypothetical protein